MTRRDSWDERLRRSARLVAITIALLPVVPAVALTATSQEYEQRIAALESRIGRLEALVDRLTTTGSVPAAGQGETASVPTEANSAAAGQPQTNAAEAEAQPPISPDDQDALQQLYVVRDAAVTLRPGRWESAVEFTYTRDDAFLQTSWALGAAATLRYGAPGGWEFGVRVPYDWTHRRTETATPGGAEVELASLGDMSFDVNRLVNHESRSWPGVVVSGGVTVPTGTDPYSARDLTPGRSPSDPFTFYRNASGHYSVDIGAEFFKTVDPFAYFAGVKFSYPFAREVDGLEVFPGYSIGYNLGATVALSESTSLGFAVLGAVNTSMVTGGKTVQGSSTAPLSTSISVLQRLADGFYLEPSITMGLTSDAPDAVLALKTTKTF